MRGPWSERAKSISLVVAGCALLVYFLWVIVRVSRIPPEPTPFPDAMSTATRKIGEADTLAPGR